MKQLIVITLVLGSIACAWGQEQPAGKFSGYMFGDYFYNVRRDSLIGSLRNTALSGTKDLQGFQLRRIYFTYDNTISDAFMTRFRLEGTTGAPIVKDAYLKWKNVLAGTDLFFGLQPTPAYDVSETAWGYRSLEKTIMDLRGIVPSRDLGISVRGNLIGGGLLSYWAMVGNNSGTNAETDKFKRYYVSVQIQPTDRLQATVYADYAAQAEVNDPATATVPRSTLSHSTLTTALFVGYGEKDRYRVGFEGFLSTTSHDFATTASTTLRSRTAAGFTVYGSVNLTPEIAAVGRFDRFEPNTASGANDPVNVPAGTVQNALARNYVIAGLSWKADKNVSIIPNIQYETYEKAARAASDPVASVTARVTFYYLFL